MCHFEEDYEQALMINCTVFCECMSAFVVNAFFCLVT